MAINSIIDSEEAPTKGLSIVERRKMILYPARAGLLSPHLQAPFRHYALKVRLFLWKPIEVRADGDSSVELLVVELVLAAAPVDFHRSGRSFDIGREDSKQLVSGHADI